MAASANNGGGNRLRTTTADGVEQAMADMHIADFLGEAPTMDCPSLTPPSSRGTTPRTTQEFQLSTEVDESQSSPRVGTVAALIAQTEAAAASSRQRLGSDTSQLGGDAWPENWGAMPQEDAPSPRSLLAPPAPPAPPSESQMPAQKLLAPGSPEKPVEIPRPGVPRLRRANNSSLESRGPGIVPQGAAADKSSALQRKASLGIISENAPARQAALSENLEDIGEDPDSALLQIDRWQIYFSDVLKQGELPEPPGSLTKELRPALRLKYKGRDVNGPPFFCAIEFCLFGFDPMNPFERSAEETSRLFRHLVNVKADPGAEATHQAGSMLAIHYASGCGSVSALIGLREAYKQKAIAETQSEDDDDDELSIQEHFDKMDRKAASDSWLDALDSKTLTPKGVPHYTPLHDATWFGCKEAVLWLLEEKANPDVLNTAGWSPLHIVAMQGYADLVTPLVQGKGALDVEDQKGEIPLVTAVNTTQFPVEKFHLLAESCNKEEPLFIDYLRDVFRLAIENEQACEVFVNILVGNDPEERANNETDEDDTTKFLSSQWGQAKDRNMVSTKSRKSRSSTSQNMMTKSTTMRSTPSSGSGKGAKRLNSYGRAQSKTFDTPSNWGPRSDGGDKDSHQDEEAVEQLAAILRHAPKAAGQIFDMLVDDPQVENMQHHPLPRRANLEQEGHRANMKCWYCDDVDADRRGPCWQFDSTKLPGNRSPGWHDYLAPFPPNSNDDQEVVVKVLRMPNVLDVKILHALSRTPRLCLFQEKTAQSVVNCFWHQVAKTSVYVHVFIMELLVLGSLTMLVVTQDKEFPGLSRFCWSLLMASLMREFFTFVWTTRERRNVVKDEWAIQDTLDTFGEVVSLSILAFLLYETADKYDMPEHGSERGVLAFNFLLRWLKMLFMIRVFPSVGPKIVCVIRSMMPMYEMLMVALVLFIGFSFSALLIKHEEPHGPIIANLFKALLLGDGEAFNSLGNLKGADNGGIFANVLTHFATLMFSICVLNLFMAVYSNEYANNEKITSELFCKERAQVCFESMLQPRWPLCWEVPEARSYPPPFKSKWLSWMNRFMFKDVEVYACCFGAMLGLSLLAVFFSFMAALPYFSALLLAAAQLLLQTFALRCNWRRPDVGDRSYLWICYSRGAFDKDTEEDTMESLRKEVRMLRQLVEDMVGRPRSASRMNRLSMPRLTDVRTPRRSSVT